MVRYQGYIEEMASTDNLSGLLNRHAFNILMTKLMSEYRREPRPLSVLMVDIDHFKSINDRHGHQTGDIVLKAIADRLKGGLRDSDLAVRWGGEEFLLVLKGCTREEAERIAENLRAVVMATPIQALGQDILATVSLGVSEYDGKETTDHLVDRVDQALYRAKTAGRNRVEAV
jgi:diguanylate cyclase (GGDEF)-like protein